MVDLNTLSDLNFPHTRHRGNEKVRKHLILFTDGESVKSRVPLFAKRTGISGRRAAVKAISSLGWNELPTGGNKDTGSVVFPINRSG
ncbi:MAG: hypothetical protein CME32_28830 [Gimesia sp.]|nr:hypothetical protein [Gimesia sp.]